MWDLHDLHRIQFFDHRDEGRLRGWRSVHVTDGDHPYMKHWWVPGLQIGYEHTFIHQVADFLQALGEGKQAAPTFRDGLATDCVTDAVLESAKKPALGKSPVARAIECCVISLEAKCSLVGLLSLLMREFCCIFGLRSPSRRAVAGASRNRTRSISTIMRDGNPCSTGQR